jgi:hypothetical protein
MPRLWVVYRAVTADRYNSLLETTGNDRGRGEREKKDW